jgi:serine/threonine-protein kinase
MTLKAGDILANRFTIVSPLGSESTPTIYKVFDQQDQRNSAIKVIAGAECSLERKDELKHQIRQISALSHPNVAHIENIYEENGLLFYTLELSEGESVYSRLRNEITRKDCDLWIKQLQSAMQAFHQIGCVMGEIRIDKMLIDINNNIHVMDFATDVPENACYEPGTIADLRAPEVKADAQPTFESDVYSLGSFAHLLATCVNPNELSKRNKTRIKLVKAAAKKIVTSSAEKRPDIAQAITLLSKEKEARVNTKNIALSLGAVLLLVVSVFHFSGNNKQPDIIDIETTQGISVINDSDFQQLSSVAALLYYPLSNWSQFSVVSPQKVSNLIDNLALQPTNNNSDQRKVADTFALNYFVVLSSRQTSQSSYLFSAELRSRSSAQKIFEVSQRATVQTLNDDLSEFSVLILEAIAEWSSYEIVKDYRPFFNSALRVTSEQSINFKLLTHKLQEFPEVHFSAAIQALDTGSKSAAELVLKQAQYKQDNGYWSLMLEQLAAQINEYPNKELQILKQIEQLYPDRIEVLMKMAVVLAETGKHDEAISKLRKALAINKQHPDVLFAIALHKFSKGMYQDAIDNELAKAQFAYRQQNDVRAESKVKLKFGEAYLKLGQQKTAKRFFSEAIDLLDVVQYPFQKASIIKQMAEISLENLEFEQAEKELLSVVEIYQRFNDVGKEIDAWLLIANVQQIAGNATKALATLQSIYTKARKEASGNDYLKLKLALAQTNYWLGDLSNASNHIRYVIEQVDLLPPSMLEDAFIVHTNILVLKGKLDNANLALAAFNARLTDVEKSLHTKLLESRLSFISNNLTQALKVNTKLLANIDSFNEPQKVAVYLWQSELCLWIADFACAEANRVEAKRHLSTAMDEHQIKEVWLTMAISESVGARKGMSPDLFFDFLNAKQMPISQRLAYLVDIQERFDLEFDSKYVKEIERLLKPSYVLLSFEYNLSRAIDTADFSKVKSTLDEVKSYWRYHYAVQQLDLFGKLEPSIIVNENTLFLQMSDIQRSNYQRYYQ